jgi:Fe-S-cluster containining protein
MILALPYNIGYTYQITPSETKIMSTQKSLSELKKNIKNPAIKERLTECNRCMTCCAKGGPALHVIDKPLIESGQLSGRFLFTIREGEPAEDNVKGGLIHTETDIIKIKSKENSDICIYADLNKNSCSIYDQRPIECRVLKCWDTDEIEKLYDKDRLTRKDIIGHIDGLWDLVEEHQEKCSFLKVKQVLAANPDKIEGDGLAELLEMVQFDISIRALVIEKTDTDESYLSFLFGIPLQRILNKFGIAFKKKDDLPNS